MWIDRGMDRNGVIPLFGFFYTEILRQYPLSIIIIVSLIAVAASMEVTVILLASFKIIWGT